MAETAKKVAKAIGATAAGACLYFAGKQNGMEAALGSFDASASAGGSGEGNAQASTTRASSKTYDPNSCTTIAPREVINERANDLKNRIVEMSFSDGDLVDRFDRLVDWGTDASKSAVSEPIESAAQVVEEPPNPESDPEAKDPSESTGNLDPYGKIERAISNSEFFGDDSSEEAGKPKPFSMP